ncbi:BTAD domain-containing putative transcriptional regulator [Kitasatospora sp. NPDC058162]|uniref:AfsR/SARP family transcriptional regulator n=1 Tax=Kitasatospora sp. NPDC058162 TaxID=3346362 RepID=UPI0036DE5793
MHFSLLGSLLVRIDGQERAVGGVKVRTLLAVLLLAANRPVPPDRLKAALWGDRPPASANASLHNMLARLRSRLGDGQGDRLRSTPLGYLLEVAEGELDAHLFDLGVQRARDALLREDWDSVHRESAAVLALWRGVPLAELPDLPEAQTPRRQWEEARLQALEWRIEAELRLGRVSGLVPELTGLTGEHPLHESFHAQLMLALHRLGQRSEALAAYQRLRRALVEELGIEPGAGVRKVHEQILRDESDGSRESDGTGRTGRTESAEETAPPAPAPAIRPQAQLPSGLADFTGRRTELRALTELLATPSADDVPRVAVVSGMGGIGKTALAVQAAHAVKHLFPDGQLYADLRGFGAGPARDPYELLAVLLAALDGRSAEHGGPARPLPEHVDDRAALLRTVLADRRVLLVLDNARDAAQVAPLLPGGRRSAVVVTTRNTLTDLPASVRLSLAPLDVEEQRAFLSRLCGPERIRQDPDGAFRLLAACAGLPLALRITGARLSSRPAWSLGTLAERLDDSRGRLRALSVGRLAVDTTFATSYLAIRDSDDPVEREAARAFRLLGLWAGHTLGVDAAAALLDRPREFTADLLELLADVHLVQTPEQWRYRFHDLLGEFAAERARQEEPAGLREAAALRLGVWYTVALETAGTVIGPGGAPRLAEPPAVPVPTFGDPQQALDWCRQELPVIKEVIRRAADSSRPDLAWRLAIWLMGYAHTFWWTGEWDACLTVALKAAQEREDLLGQAWTLRRIGASHGMAYRNDEAIEALEAALAVFDDHDDDLCMATILGNLSTALSQQGRHGPALAYAQQAWKLHREAGGDEGTPGVLAALAQAYLRSGDFEAAHTHFREVLGLCRARGNLTHAAVALANLGDCLRGLGRRGDAFAALDESLAIRRRLGDMSGIADTLIISGRTHAHFGDLPQARACFEQAAGLSRDHNIPAYVQQSLDGLERLRDVRR